MPYYDIFRVGILNIDSNPLSGNKNQYEKNIFVKSIL